MFWSFLLAALAHPALAWGPDPTDFARVPNGTFPIPSQLGVVGARTSVLAACAALGLPTHWDQRDGTLDCTKADTGTVDIDRMLPADGAWIFGWLKGERDAARGLDPSVDAYVITSVLQDKRMTGISPDQVIAAVVQKYGTTGQSVRREFCDSATGSLSCGVSYYVAQGTHYLELGVNVGWWNGGSTDSSVRYSWKDYTREVATNASKIRRAGEGL